MGLAVRLGPGHLPGIMLGLEMPMTLRPAEFEHFAVIPHERYAMPRVDWPRTEVTLIYSHFNNIINIALPLNVVIGVRIVIWGREERRLNNV